MTLMPTSAWYTQRIHKMVLYNQKRDDMSNIIAQGLSFFLEHCQGFLSSLFWLFKHGEWINYKMVFISVNMPDFGRNRKTEHF